MKEIYKDYLFTKGILVSDDTPAMAEDMLCLMVTLMQKFAIRITEGFELLNQTIVEDAARSLDDYIPEPFYRGFPNSVRRLTSDQLLFDQLYHYFQTYGLDIWGDSSGHSLVEEVEKTVFREKTELKEFRILNEADAKDILASYLLNLASSQRPLSGRMIYLLLEAYKDYAIYPEKIPCKDTALRYYYETKNRYFLRFLKLSDTIKMLNYIQLYRYGNENLKKLNLRNCDRKVISGMLDYFLEKPNDDQLRECFEKRKIWCGLLHHIHYKPKSDFGRSFVVLIRESKTNFSVYSSFEKQISEGRPEVAASILNAVKGSSAVIRRMDYILSRCQTEEQIKEVLKCLE